jgi:methylenetetrahydrofolate--tRNA-(uracil-5-)-methyltransferase
LKSAPHIRFAGQITGCEGYIESCAVGLMAARFATGWFTAPPQTTALGALLEHITGGADAESYQPMNVNFGLFPPPPAEAKKKDRKRAYTDRARTDLAAWLSSLPQPELAA